MPNSLGLLETTLDRIFILDVLPKFRLMSAIPLYSYGQYTEK